MKRKTILIAETNAFFDEKIRKLLKRYEDCTIVLNNKPENSKQLLEDIYTYKPDIVITNEKKKDFPATDVINKIQSDLSVFQPTFIIVSAFDDIELVCKNKEIMAYYIRKPFKDNDLLECINATLSNERLKNNENVFFIDQMNFSNKNIEYITNIIINNERYFKDNKEYDRLGKQISDINKKLEMKLPNTQKLFREFAEVLYKSYDYEMCFLYQYLMRNFKK